VSLHNDPQYNTPEIIARMKAHGMDVDKPSMLSDAFRLGYMAAQPGWKPGRCEGCTCEFGGADCAEIKKYTRETTSS